MNKWNTAVLLVFGLLSSGASALDLTPHEILVSNDGPPAKRYFFRDDDQRLSFRIDNKMTVNGASDSVAFRFNDIKGAAMKLSKSPMHPVLPFDEKNLEAYRTTARTFLPSEATNIQLEEEISEAIAINGWTSRQFIFTYNLFDLALRRSVTFVNFHAQEQIVFEIAAPAADYPKAYARGYRVLNSISKMPAISISGPT